ncbi:ATP-binding protein [Nocardioides bruguierae]|uniref:ATP-binding protein n=1 Tax=Nocardioides bruguierae TaxID=2945102 RepID=A0A9X2IG08_9ACTN|nr:ATP-binding protein [Nocardioides bruguierae]MCL8026803.1 ATP-binding protein [Nocardioides bruguierae]MCM0621069.1 ATP-binding protein [Nocardioides bruguierae]
MDPIRNPYAPGAGQRPPELAGRDTELSTFDVVLERVARGRPERSMVLTGLRGVGKTVLLNALRGAAVRRGWGTGKLEARPDQTLRRPLAGALHQAVRELGHPSAEESDQVLGVLRAFVEREAGADAKLRDRWSPGIEVPAARGRADSGDIEIDLVELLTDVGGLAADVGKGVAVFIDEMQDLGPADVSALCAAVHEIGQQGLPVIVVGAGLPHLPAVLSASKSYSERLFRYARIDRLTTEAANRALAAPAAEEDAEFTPDGLAAMYRATGGYPYFIQAYGKTVWDLAPRSPITAEDVEVAAPEAEAELAVGFFGSRYERATPAERDYLRAMADAAAQLAPLAEPASDQPDTGARPAVETVESVATSDVAAVLGKKPQSLSPARDALMKKGLIYSGERGRISFTVPHFGRYLRGQD